MEIDGKMSLLPLAVSVEEGRGSGQRSFCVLPDEVEAARLLTFFK